MMLLGNHTDCIIWKFIQEILVGIYTSDTKWKPTYGYNNCTWEYIVISYINSYRWYHIDKGGKFIVYILEEERSILNSQAY